MSAYDALIERFVQACIEGRAMEAMNLALRALDESPQKLSLGMFYDDILQPAQQLVGELWHEREATVAQEHATSETVRSVAALARSRFERTSRRAERVVLACPPEELHDLGLRLLADVLDLDGFETHLLGANTPTADLVSYAAGVSADAVLLSASTTIGYARLVETATALLSRTHAPVVVAGGYAVEHGALESVAYGHGAADAAAVVERALAEQAER